MGITFGGHECGDPAELYDYCLATGLPTADWLGKANGFSCPLGKESGEGHVLLTYGQLRRLDLNTQHDLIFDDGQKKATLKNLVVAWHKCVTPGLRGDDSAWHRVDLYDRRILKRFIAVDASYNRLSCDGDMTGTPPSGSGGCSGSGPGYTAWEWEHVACELWALLDLGTFPGLPFDPQDVPYNFTFYASYAWDALNTLLDRIGCAVQYNPLTDTFGIVRIGEADATVETALRELDAARVWDYEPPTTLTLANVPAGVRVRFRRYPAAIGNNNPYYTVSVAKPASVTTPTAAGSSIVIDDDMPALGSTGTPSNSSALTARAEERRDDYYRLLLSGLNRVFTGVVTDSRLLPGKQIKAIAWRDVGAVNPDGFGPKGLTTEVYRGQAVVKPYDLARFPAAQYVPVCTGTGSGSGSGNENCAGIPVSELVRCNDEGTEIRDACLTIQDGALVLLDSTGSVIVGG